MWLRRGDADAIVHWHLARHQDLISTIGLHPNGRTAPPWVRGELQWRFPGGVGDEKKVTVGGSEPLLDVEALRQGGREVEVPSLEFRAEIRSVDV